MDFVVQITKFILGKELPLDYSIYFVLFVLFSLAFTIWALYFSFYKGGISELGKVSWLPTKDVLKISITVIIMIILFSGVIFLNDFILDYFVNIIFSYAKG